MYSFIYPKKNDKKSQYKKINKYHYSIFKNISKKVTNFFFKFNEKKNIKN